MMSARFVIAAQCMRLTPVRSVRSTLAPALMSARTTSARPNVMASEIGEFPEVSPGADPRAIHLRYSGHDSIELTDAGEIVLDSGSATVIDTKPVAYQHINGRTVSVPIRFVQFDADVAFSVGEYDKTRPLLWSFEVY